MRLFFFIILICLLPCCTDAQSYNNKMVFAHYLPWYDASGSYPSSWQRRGWCYEGDCSDFSNIHYSNKPLIGEYSLSDSDVIEYHILTALMAGIDGFIINLDPSSSYQNTIVIDILDEINSLKSTYNQLNDFKVIISYDNSSTDATTINNYFSLIYNNIYNHVSYESLIFRDETNNEQILIAWSESDPSQYYTTANSIWGMAGIQLLIRNSINFDISDGNFQWVNGFSNSANQNTNWGENYFNDFEWIVSRQTTFGLSNPANENRVMMGMAYPGFDDENVPNFWNGGNHRLIKRDVSSGETMALTWDRQINYVANGTGGTSSVENPWIQLITWNDWPEGTSIEPGSMDTYGFKPLQTTKSKVDIWKGNNGFDMDCIVIPYLIYNAKKEGYTIEANDGMSLMMSGDCAAAKILLEPLLNIPLPLEIISIGVKCEGNQATLEWETAFEEQISHFEIEQLNPKNNWETIGSISANNFPSKYTFNLHQNNYFRIKTIELDDSVEYSKIIKIDCFTQEFSARIYPNPTRDITNLSITSHHKTRASISFVDVLGQVVFKEEYLLENGETLISIKNLNLNSGLYHIFLTTADKTEHLGKSSVK